MKKVHPNAAGIDIGAKMTYVSLEDQRVVAFETFTAGFRMTVEYLLSNKVETVTMEARGVYWLILYEMPEGCGRGVWLVDGRQTK